MLLPSRALLLAFTFIGLFQSPATFGQAATPPAGKPQSHTLPALPPPPQTKQVIYAPVAGIEDFSNWEIEIANRTNRDIPATVTVYSAEGRPFPSTAVTLGSNQIQRMDIRHLIPGIAGRDSEKLGGIAVEFTAVPMAVAAQLTLSSFHGAFGNIDAILVSDMMFNSSEADAVWWQPEGARSFLILGNSSAQPISAELTFGPNRTRTVRIDPNATAIQPVSEDSESQEAKIQSVHAVGTGMPGTLRMLGYSVSERDGFLNTIRSYDPAMSSAPATYANGMHFSSATNHLVVKNATQSPINVWGTIYPLTTNGSSKMIAIAKASLVADSSAELELPAADESLDGAAIQLESSGPNGAFVASYISHDRNNQMTRSMPFKGIPEGSSPAGGYPWRLDGNYDSRTYITNVSKVRAAFGAFIDPKDGKRYVIDTHFLEPGETAIIDFRKLRDQQIPDRNRLKLPKDVKFGAIQWFPLFFNGSQHFIGRTEVIDRSSAVAASFSCESCPCPPDAGSGYVTPGSSSYRSGIPPPSTPP
jgi:hypothetical protein